MEKYRFEPSILRAIENSRVPFAVYQFIERRVVTVALTAGFCKLFGIADIKEAYWLMDNNMYRDTHPDDVAAIADEAFRFATEGGTYNVVYRSLTMRNEGEYRVIHAIGEHYYPEEGVRLAVVWYINEGICSDTEGSNTVEDLNYSFSRMLREESMQNMTYYDNLTGLPKMGYFFELADAARREADAGGRSLSMVYLDLCGMRHYNRKFGFSEGDKLLKEFGHILAAEFGNENSCRLGQDLFAVIADSDGVEKHIKQVFAKTKQLNGGRTLPVRAGIYLDRFGNVDVPEAVDRAKMACDVTRGAYISSYTYFESSMLEAAAERQYILDNFDTALDEGYIQVYYQPVVRTANGRVCHEESLARWIDPVKGFMNPGQFIPVLEDAMLIYRLDLYVLKQTILKMKRLKKEGLYIVPSSINLSRSDFEVCDMVDEVRSIVDEEGIPHELIVIELTESIVGSDFDYMKKQIERFRNLGFSVWMDDFGSGYSSLDVLQSIQFDVIKLDMRFMQQFDSSDKSKIILTELVRMATGLGIKTVAEGVELPEQVEFLKEIGCTMLQGYHFCPAIPLDAILKRYREKKQIGFENPNESEYYSAIGAINLYDPASVASEDISGYGSFFDTMPAAILEVNGDAFTVARCNRSFKEFVKRGLGRSCMGRRTRTSEFSGKSGNRFISAIASCARDGQKKFVDEQLTNGTRLHAFIRRISVDPVTSNSAVAVVVLALE